MTFKPTPELDALLQRISDQEQELPSEVTCPYCGALVSKWGRTWTVNTDDGTATPNPCRGCPGKKLA